MPPVALCKSFDPCCFGRFDVVAVVDAAAALLFVGVAVVDAVFFYYFGSVADDWFSNGMMTCRFFKDFTK